MKNVLTILILITLGTRMHAQERTSKDSVATEQRDGLIKEKKDTVLLKSYASRYDPRKALLYAAVLPGAGQVYTKKYWKIPLVYGGMAFVGYRIDFYQKAYSKYKLELFRLIDDPTNTTISAYSQEQLRNIVNKARRERDFMIIIMGLVYVLQIVDAHVDAHLKEFDVNPKLQVRFEPTLENDIVLGRQAGFAVKFRF